MKVTTLVALAGLLCVMGGVGIVFGGYGLIAMGALMVIAAVALAARC